MRISRELAQKYLSEVPEQNHFWINNSSILKSLNELAEALKDIDDNAYSYHVNKEKNDFSNWIRDIVGDEKLANDLLISKNKGSALNKVKSRVMILKKLAKY